MCTELSTYNRVAAFYLNKGLLSIILEKIVALCFGISNKILQFFTAINFKQYTYIHTVEVIMWTLEDNLNKKKYVFTHQFSCHIIGMHTKQRSFYPVCGHKKSEHR